MMFVVGFLLVFGTTLTPAFVVLCRMAARADASDRDAIEYGTTPEAGPE